MSLNQSHQAGVGNVLLFYGERLLIFYDGCELKLGTPLKGSHTGRVYLTSHRVVFVNKNSSSGLLSFSMPFVKMKEVDIKQPVFGANSIVGRVSADPNGGWQGEAEFKLIFKKGGAIEFGQALIELGRRACSAKQEFRAPPPYAPAMDMNGASQYYSCPPPAYAPPFNDPYYGFVKPHEAFTQPPPSTLYYTGAPPPYPGAAPPVDNGWGTAPPVSNGWAAPPPVGHGWATAPAYQQAASGSSQPSQPPYPLDGAGAVGRNLNSSDVPMSDAHAAKAAEAAAGASNSVTGGYYFREDPHNVYAPATAPPADDLPPPYMEPYGESQSNQPPPYPGGASNARDKKNQ